MYVYARTRTPKLPQKALTRPMLGGHHPGVPAVLGLLHDRSRQEVHQVLPHAHSTRPGPAAAVRRREGLVQVVVHHVEAHLAGLGDPQDGVEVGAVAVHQRTVSQHHPQHLLHPFVEEAEGVGIGHHEPHQVRAVLLDEPFQDRQVDVAAAVRRHLDDLEARHGGGGRIRAVGRIGHEDDVAMRLALVVQVLAHHQHAGELAVSARCRLERDLGEPCDLGQDRLQVVHHPMAPCTLSSAWSGCSAAKPGSRAAASFTLGLYFMVHDPRG